MHCYLCDMLDNSKPDPIFSTVQQSLSAAFQSISNADLAVGSCYGKVYQLTETTEVLLTIHILKVASGYSSTHFSPSHSFLISSVDDEKQSPLTSFLPFVAFFCMYDILIQLCIILLATLAILHAGLVQHHELKFQRGGIICYISVFILQVQLDRVARREVTAINTSVHKQRQWGYTVPSCVIRLPLYCPHWITVMWCGLGTCTKTVAKKLEVVQIMLLVQLWEHLTDHQQLH